LILMVGTMTQRKGVDLLLEAWPQVRSQHPSAHLVLIGGTDRPTIVEAAQRARAATHQQKLQSLMEPGLQAGSIIRHDAVDCIEHWMRVADLLVLASEREGVPNVVLEAMASGTPCLLTPFLGLPREELGPCGEAWHLCQRNSAAIAQEMNCLLANANALPRWGRLAAEHAARNFALEDSVNAYASLYRGLVDARLSGA
jgi:glycosyltransferase involved in cell wall biosynthesis